MRKMVMSVAVKVIIYQGRLKSKTKPFARRAASGMGNFAEPF